jgi:PqqD family protein of HPr-rel-A system
METPTPRLLDLALSDTGFVFDPTTGHNFTVNPTGLQILQWLKTGIAMDEIARRLTESFELEPEEDPGRDAQDFIMQLRECGLVR